MSVALAHPLAWVDWKESSMAGTVSYPTLFGARSPMRGLYKRIEAAAIGGNLLIVGDSGTDMEMIARLIHQCSPRQNRPFVGLNCAALPRDLIDSELFGYERGAFKGATSEHRGLFHEAEGGTLFLDEITEMSAETQSNLALAVQHRAIRPIGAAREQPVDVRILVSFKRESSMMMVDACLREDLSRSLQARVLALPPFREGCEDIALMAEHFIAVVNKHHQPLGA